MKPPHNRHGGPGRPSSDRGPFRSSGGPGAQQTGSFRAPTGEGRGSRPGPGPARSDKPSRDGAPRPPRPDGTRWDGARSDGPQRQEHPRHDRPRHGSGPQGPGGGPGGGPGRHGRDEPRPFGAPRGATRTGPDARGPDRRPRPDDRPLAGAGDRPRPEARPADGHRGDDRGREAFAPGRPPRRDGPRPPADPNGLDRAPAPPTGERLHARGPHRPATPPGPPPAPAGTIWLYGHHAIAAALANPSRRLRRLLLTEEAEAALAALVPQPWPLAVDRTDRARLDHLLGREAVHQGAALLADPLAPPSLAQMLERPGPVLVLDQVTDPRNVGAILRCAAAFGAAGVITQERNAPEETGSLAKAASGALETVPLLRAVNVARTLVALKAADRWVVGLDAGGPTPLSGPAFAGRRVALVLGAEGSGLRRLTRETCDELAGLATEGAMASLNVAAAAAVALYELTRRA